MTTRNARLTIGMQHTGAFGVRHTRTIDTLVPYSQETSGTVDIVTGTGAGTIFSLALGAIGNVSALTLENHAGQEVGVRFNGAIADQFHIADGASWTVALPATLAAGSISAIKIATTSTVAADGYVDYTALGTATAASLAQYAHLAAELAANVPTPTTGLSLYHDTTLASPAFKLSDGSLQPVARGLVIPATDGDTVSAAKLAAMADNVTIEVGPVEYTTTIAGATHTLLTIPIAASQDITVVAHVRGADAGGSRCDCTIVGVFTRNGSAAAIEKTNVHGSPYVLDDAAWAPALVLSTNDVLVQIVPDTVYSVHASVTLEIEVRSTASMAGDPLAAVKALVDSVGGFVLQADVGVTEHGDNAGYCSQWSDQSGNGFTFSQTTHANQPAISTLADGRTPALVYTGTEGVALDGVVPVQASTGPWSCYLAFEPTSDDGTECIVYQGGTGTDLLIMQGAAGLDGHDNPSWVDIHAGSDDVESAATAQTAGLQILAFKYNGVNGYVERNGTLLRSSALATRGLTQTGGGATGPYLLNSNAYNAGVNGRVRALVWLNAYAAAGSANDLAILAGLRAHTPTLP
jgi:hypothetical protein